MCDSCYTEVADFKSKRERARSEVKSPLAHRQTISKGKFQIPVGSDMKPQLLFCIKTEDRDLWLYADTLPLKHAWVDALQQLIMVANLPIPAAIEPAKEWEIEYSQIQILNKAGDGAFGEVFKGRLWGTEVAVKVIKGDITESALADLKKEISILSQIRHPNIVLYLGCCTKEPNVCIVTEWCEKGSVFDLIHKKNIVLSTKRMIQMALDAAQGMNYLHHQEKKIIHRDLKADNLFCSKNWSIKVGDFGLSHIRENIAHNPVRPPKSIHRTYASGKGVLDKEDDSSVCSPKNVAAFNPPQKQLSEKGNFGVYGTPQWMAPEVMEGLAYNSKVDVYSFGILLCELVSRSMPFADKYDIESFNDIVSAVLENGAIPTIPDWCEQTFKPLILRCLLKDPTKRPTFNDIVRYLRAMLELSDAELFDVQDIPRLQHMLFSPERAKQEQAATELAEFAEDTRKMCVQCSYEPQVAANADKLCSNGFLSRLACLLNSQSERVRLASSRALRNLLKLSDIRNRREEKQSICTVQTLRTLLNMSCDSNPKNKDLVDAARAILIEISYDSDLNSRAFKSLGPDLSKKLARVLAIELASAEDALHLEAEKVNRRGQMLLDFTKFAEVDNNRDFESLYEMKGDEIIGRGQFSTVKICTERSTGKQYVVKVLATAKSFDKNVFDGEYEIVSKVYHNSILRHEGYLFNPDLSRLYLVMEHASHGEVFDWVVQRGYITERDVSKLIRQLISAFGTIAGTGLVYSTLKPERVLVNGSDPSNPLLKLGDFGLPSLYITSEIKKRDTILNFWYFVFACYC